MRHLATSAMALGLALAAGSASAERGIEAGSVRILSTDVPALDAVIEAAKGCASDAVTVEANSTAEHSVLQVLAPSGDPAGYAVEILANDSIAPLLNGRLLRRFDTNALSSLYADGKVAIMNMWGSRAGSFLDPAQAQPEVAENTVFAAAPTVGGGTTPATTIWWDGFAIARNVSDEDAEASFRAMLHRIGPDTASENTDLAAWLIEGFQPGPASQGLIASAKAGARPYPMVPQMGVLHGALGAELADFMAGSETAEQAPADVAAAYETAAREQGFLQ